MVLGGSASGKSEFAEDFCGRLSDAERALGGSGERTYLATMEPFGEEAKKRIQRHQSLRLGKGFRTVEAARQIEKAAGDCRGVVLLETLSVLLANEMFAGEEIALDAEAKVLSGIHRLYGSASVSHLILVSDQIFSGSATLSKETVSYQRALAQVHGCLAAEAEVVVEVIGGKPCFHKVQSGAFL